MQTASAQLTWSHYIELLSIDNTNEINYYIKISEEQNLSVRELRSKIKNKEYERLDDKTIGIIIVRKENKFIMEYLCIKNLKNYEKMLDFTYFYCYNCSMCDCVDMRGC